QEERRIHEEARQLPSFISQDRMPPAQEMKIKMERERIRQEAARTVDERSREILKQERAHLHDIHRALKQVKRESVYPIALQKEHYTKTQFLSREVEEIMDLIGTAREEMMRLNLVRVKMVYEDIMRLYLRLSPREKGSVHQEIHDLYNERKRAEALFTHY
ncbi:MAG: hypothetical protein Q7S65_06325, partial [Nanoarchaeota archaeon]|nr:hypothetical protein [Nanoarchaeota archaeon]